MIFFDKYFLGTINQSIIGEFQMCTASVGWLGFIVFSMFATVILWAFYEAGLFLWRQRSTITKIALAVWSLPEMLHQRRSSN